MTEKKSQKKYHKNIFWIWHKGCGKTFFPSGSLGVAGGCRRALRNYFHFSEGIFLLHYGRRFTDVFFHFNCAEKEFPIADWVGGCLPQDDIFSSFVVEKRFTIPENAKYSADFLFWARSSIPPFDSSNTDSFDILLHPRWIGGGWIGGGLIECGLIVRGGYRLWPSRQGWKELRKNYERTTKTGGVSFNARENREIMTSRVTKTKNFSDFFISFFFPKKQKNT